MQRDTILRDHYNIIRYSDKDWNLLKEKRELAIKLLEIFVKEGFNPYIFGSVARGNVHQNSDIDIIFTHQIPTFQIEYILNKCGYYNYFREIIMATPKDSLKLYIYLSELESITIPLSKFDKKHEDFYNFGGKIDINQLKSGIRVPGIDKRLVLIKPNPQGHEEISIINNESIVAKVVGVSLNIINERKKVLLRRNKYGKTGVFLKRKLDINESTEEVLKKLANQKTIIRKKLFER
ncbi:MAG: nucleotidyltransferase domain-containing protein [Promethearchaeota archaeon]